MKNKLKMYQQPIPTSALVLQKGSILKVDMRSCLGRAYGTILMYISGAKDLTSYELSHIDSSNTGKLWISFEQTEEVMVFGEVML